MQNRIVSRAVVSYMINQSQGTFIGATYTRKDGSVTTLNGRLGCKLNTCRQKTTPPADARFELFTLYDVKRKGYRSISLDRLERITLKGFTFKVFD
jgi:hypothetical protein